MSITPSDDLTFTIPCEMPDILQDILDYAKETKCADIHIAYSEYPIFRIFNKISRNQFLPVLTNQAIQDIIKYALENSDMENIPENFTDLDFCFSDEDGTRYRTNIMKKRGHYGLVLRVCPNTIFPLESRGLPASLYQLLDFPNGLILVTGPTGSGKSSTVSALINHINMNCEKHILTLEDPIEYVYPKGLSLVSQREIGKDVENFARAIRAGLREDPDVIFVGEMRDTETITATLSAAETGHLVFSTLHTISASKTIDRLIDVFPSDKQSQIKTQLASTLRAVISQVLLPKADGTGMVPAIEVMIVNEAISSYIKNNQKNMIESEILAKQNMGMISMKKSIESLVYNGQVLEKDADPYLKALS